MMRSPTRRVAVGTLLSLILCRPGGAQDADSPSASRLRAAPPPQPGFRSPEAAVEALVVAARAGSQPRLLSLLGPGAATVIRSGDAEANRVARIGFMAAFDKAHALQRPDASTAVLEIGEDKWPLPIPLRERGGLWRFDSRAGVQEIIDRRIGRNELDAIQVCLAIADAQRDYAAASHDGQPAGVYARRLISSVGRQDGLWWETAPGEPPSPLGPMVAAASTGGYRVGSGDRPQAYRGYYFRILGAQGPNAPGGAMDYVVRDRMIGGFAVLAWPSRHGNTGIMSFMVSHDGQVFERNLGPDTDRIARAIRSFDPGPGWTKVDAS